MLVTSPCARLLAMMPTGEKALSQRKAEHIRLSLSRDQERGEVLTDDRFDYEPLLGHQNLDDIDISVEFLNKKFHAPLWISSMTGGTGEAGQINRRLARGAARFGLGMGVGSLRPLLEGDRKGKRMEDYHLRPLLGADRPLYGNLGIVQVGALLQEKRVWHLSDLLGQLDYDGLIIHINPLQEWYQKEGELLNRTPLSIIEDFLAQFSLPLLVKEVGQGMGPRSLHGLMELPLAAIELSGSGGSNFAHLEWERSGRKKPGELAWVGHRAREMVDWINERGEVPGGCNQFILSGGIRSFLDGYYLMEKLNFDSVYGQAAPVLERAAVSQEELDQYLRDQFLGLKMAKSFLRVR